MTRWDHPPTSFCVARWPPWISLWGPEAPVLPHIKSCRREHGSRNWWGSAPRRSFSWSHLPLQLAVHTQRAAPLTQEGRVCVALPLGADITQRPFACPSKLLKCTRHCQSRASTGPRFSLLRAGIRAGAQHPSLSSKPKTVLQENSSGSAPGQPVKTNSKG